MQHSAYSRIQATRAYMGHICSACGNPVVTTIGICTHVRNNYVIMSSSADKHADEDTRQAIDYQLTIIRTCEKYHRCLSSDPNNGAYDGNNYARSWLENVATPCPTCGHLEKWQVPDGYTEKSENYPTAYMNPKDAMEWANDVMRKQIADIKSARQDADRITQAASQCRELYAQLQALQHEFNTLPELLEKKQLDNTIRILTEEKKHVGIFDFQNNRRISADIRRIESRLAQIDPIAAEKASELRLSISHINRQLLVEQSIAYGFDSPSTTQRAQSVSFRLMPHPLPAQESAAQEVTVPVSEPTVPSQSTESVAFCKFCGFKLLPDSRFCSRCGKRVEEEPT